MISDDTILTALRALLLAILPSGTEVIAGQTNRVPEPASPDFVTMIPLSRSSLSTTVEDWTHAGTPVALDNTRDMQVTVQLDIHGPGAADNATLVTMLVRSDFACRQMAGTGVQPLYTTDPLQMPYINGANQYENRWTMNVATQVTPLVSTPMQFADSVAVTIPPPVGA